MLAAAASMPLAAGPRRITFVTNPDVCNLSCRMCREHSPLARRGGAPARVLSLELVARVIADGRRAGLVEVIPSTQGEPLLWPGLSGLAALCAAEGLLLNVTTNGTFPILGARGWAERLLPVAADVKVSWNGACAATAEAIMDGLRFEDAVAGVRELARARDDLRRRGARAGTVSFQVTAQERNVAELPDVVRLAASLGVDRVKVNQLQVHFSELAAGDLRRSATSRARWNAAVRAARAAARAGLLASRREVVLQNFDELDERGADPPRGPCPFLGREAWVTAGGDFSPCPSAAGLSGELGRFGSLHARALGDVWRGAEYRDLVAGFETRAACAGCAFRRPGGV